MSVSVSVTLPFPPSVNNLFAGGRLSKRRFTSKKYANWQRAAGWEIVSARMSYARLSYPVTVRIDLHPADDRPRDADNYSKAILDQLKKCGVLQDDSKAFIQQVTVAWAHKDKLNPRANVTITSAGAGGPRLENAELISGV